MRHSYKFKLTIGTLLLFCSFFISQIFAQSKTFTFTGANQTWQVPAGVTQITISAFGAQGGTGGGNAGAWEQE